jgi:hypothetical protein
MPKTVRLAVSVPQPVARAVTELARTRHESRSRFLASLIARVAAAKRDRDIAAAIDALFADPTIVREQLSVANDFLRLATWPEEKW